MPFSKALSQHVYFYLCHIHDVITYRRMFRAQSNSSLYINLLFIVNLYVWYLSIVLPILFNFFIMLYIICMYNSRVYIYYVSRLRIDYI